MGSATVVVNRRVSEFDVYIGRGSKWGNPFSHKPGTKADFIVGSRDEAIASYREWLHRSIRQGSITLQDLASLSGKRLGCYCKPAPCHGDVLVRASEWASGELKKQ